MTLDEKYMLEAAKEARKRLGRTEPNPAVGAIVIKNNTVLARGFHQGAGHPHAEVEALKNLLDDQTRGSTLYVTLEPCCHQGRTPPCTDLIVKRGIKKVIYGMRDPNPLVSGKGCEVLKANKVEVVECGLAEVHALYEGYAHWQLTKKPFVTLKIALSKDGKMAGLKGKRIKLTCEETDKFTHEKRLESSAILTTAVTINADDPLLDCRLVSSEKKKVFIVDRNKKLKQDRKIFTSASSVIVFNGENILATIGEKELHNVWVEAGPTYSKYLLENNLVDRLVVYHSPLVVGEGISFAIDSTVLKQFKLTREFTLGTDQVKQWLTVRRIYP